MRMIISTLKKEVKKEKNKLNTLYIKKAILNKIAFFYVSNLTL